MARGLAPYASCPATSGSPNRAGSRVASTSRTTYSARAWCTKTSPARACSVQQPGGVQHRPGVRAAARPSGRGCPARPGRSGSPRRPASGTGRAAPRAAGRRPRSRSGSGWPAPGTAAAPGRSRPPIETCPSAITSSSADCTLAGARLISSASTRFAITGPSSTSKRLLRRPVDPGAEDVRRHQVRGELDAVERAAHRDREGLRGERLGHARSPLRAGSARRPAARSSAARPAGPARRSPS